MRLFRFIKIIAVARRYGVDTLILEQEPGGWLGRAARFFRVFGARAAPLPRGERIRRMLEDLGPIFVKFGQVLSTRRDLLPVDIADELAKLQDRVPPFSAEQVHAQIAAAYGGRRASEVFAEFEETPVASASVAQVHFARLRAEDGGHEVAVKILRLGMEKVVANDLALLDSAAGLLEAVWADGRRLKPHEVVAEFAKYLYDEFDLMRESANASQLRRNFAGSALLRVPEVYWDLCTTTVMVMERMHGLPISQKEALVAAGVDLKALSRAGVEIFFTQVFRDGFFHADMHPGNIFVAVDPEHFGKYIALDFGIVGSLTDYDKRYLAINFLAFFNRDYHRVATAHIESGWVPPETRAEELEAAVRAVCEPVFNKPISEISFGLVLMRLFEVSRRFNVEIQPQLVLLQKTLLNIEGLGRQLEPDLDLWATAKPFLVRWMNEQVGPKAFWRNLKNEAPDWAEMLPALPRKLNALVDEARQKEMRDAYVHLVKIQQRQSLWLAVIAVALVLILLFK